MQEHLYRCYGKYKTYYHSFHPSEQYKSDKISELDFVIYDFEYRLVRTNKTECSTTMSDMFNRLYLYRSGQWTQNIVLEIHVEYVKSY